MSACEFIPEGQMPIRKTVYTVAENAIVATYYSLVDDAMQFFAKNYSVIIKKFFIIDKNSDELPASDIVFYGKDAYASIQEQDLYAYVTPSFDFGAHLCLWPFSFRMLEIDPVASYKIPHEIVDSIRPHLRGRKENKNYIQSRLHDIQNVYEHLANDESKKCYLSIIQSLATGDPGYIFLSNFAQYMHPECLPVVGDVVIDGGLETAGTPIMFADLVSELGEVVGFEPVPSQAANCRRDVADRDNITIVEQGLSSCKGNFFIHGGGAGSFLSHEGFDGAIECTTTDIDSCCIENGKSPTLIKLDIEGSEQAALRGSKFVLGNYHPKVMISLYHRIEDYIDIPLFFINKYPEYSLYIGHHSPWWNETILYGVPGNITSCQSSADSQIGYIVRPHDAKLMNVFFEKLEEQQKKISELCGSNQQVKDILKEIYSCLLSTEYEHMPLYRFIWRSTKKKLCK